PLDSRIDPKPRGVAAGSNHVVRRRQMARRNSNPERRRPGSAFAGESMALRSQLVQLQSQFRNLEVSRPASRSYSSSSRTVLSSSSRNTGPEQPPRNKEDEEKFLAENKTRPGVVTLPSGLQYKVIWPGYG